MTPETLISLVYLLGPCSYTHTQRVLERITVLMQVMSSLVSSAEG